MIKHLDYEDLHIKNKSTLKAKNLSSNHIKKNAMAIELAEENKYIITYI